MWWKKKKTSAKGSEFDLINEQKKIGTNLNFQATEAYKLLRTNLEFSFADEKKCRVIGITSAVSAEGKSLTAINVAYAIATNEKKVLLIESDFRKPTIAAKLGMKQNVGLTDLLVDPHVLLSDMLAKVELSQNSQFDLAQAGRVPPNPAELLDSNKMKVFLESCAEIYDYILIDLPPVTIVADAVIASKYIDGMVVVVRQDRSDQKSLAETIRQLKFSNTKILGFVFNGYNQEKSGYYKKYAHNGYRSYKSYKSYHEAEYENNNAPQI